MNARDKEIWEKSQQWDSSDDGRGKLKILESVEKFADLIRADKPVLEDIEQYRMQMAAICTAAIGYWTKYDSISPDYDTVALRDVAKLYAKYDALYKAQQGAVAHDVIAGALFDFMAWLTSRPKRIMLSSVDDASPAVDAIKDFAKMRGLSLDNAQVQTWQEALAEPEQEPVAWYCKEGLKRGVSLKQENPEWIPLYTFPPQRTWVSLTDEEMQAVVDAQPLVSSINVYFKAIEAKLKEKNT